MPAVAGTLLCALERNLPMTPPADKPPGAIVILGAEVTHTAAAQPGDTVGRLTLERLRAGAALQRKTRLPILVSGGVIGDDPPPIAVLMRQSLTQDFQVPGALDREPLTPTPGRTRRIVPRSCAPPASNRSTSSRMPGTSAAH